jgi:hypothetical protein
MLLLLLNMWKVGLKGFYRMSPAGLDSCIYIPPIDSMIVCFRLVLTIIVLVVINVRVIMYIMADLDRSHVLKVHGADTVLADVSHNREWDVVSFRSTVNSKTWLLVRRLAILLLLLLFKEKLWSTIVKW